MQPSVVPFQQTQYQDVSLTRKTATGRVVKTLNFNVGHKTAPRSARWSPGVAHPDVESCVKCIPEPTNMADMRRVLTCSWFYFKGGDGETLDRVYEQIGLISTLFAVIVQGMLSSAKDLENQDLRGFSVILMGTSMILLVSAAFFSIVHLVFSQKMTLDSQVIVFDTLSLYSVSVRYLSPIAFLQYGMIAGWLGGVFWVVGFLELQYSLPFALVLFLLMCMTTAGFVILQHAGIGVLESEPLRIGEQASLDWKALKILLDAYEDDCGSEFMSPEGFASFIGECLLKPGCQANELCELSHVTRLRMDAMISLRFEELADYKTFDEQVAPLMHRCGTSPTLGITSFSPENYGRGGDSPTAGFEMRAVRTSREKPQSAFFKKKAAETPRLETLGSGDLEPAAASEEHRKEPQKSDAAKKKHKKHKTTEEEAAGFVASGSSAPGCSPAEVVLGNAAKDDGFTGL